ncbi:MAG: hypothetical protein MZW92_30515 [Comamonadaceae bacterium]|nr:hypothetical protein [Comamonadaceae bacterium]
MTPEQARELNRIADQDRGAAGQPATTQGLKGLKISGYMDPTYIYNRAPGPRRLRQFLNDVATTATTTTTPTSAWRVIDFQKETDSGTRWQPDAGARTAAPAR